MDLTAHIEVYLQDELNPVERQAFEQRLLSDPVFATEYKIQLAAHRIVLVAGPSSKKEMLQHHEIHTYHRRHPRSIVLLWVAAAAAILIVLWVIIPMSTGPTNQELYAEYFEIYRDPVSIRGAESETTLRESANNAYRAQDYVLAADLYRQIADPVAVDSFYLALSLLQKEAPGSAIEILEQIALGQSDYHEQASWYLALAYLKAGRKTDASIQLTGIVKSGEYQYSTAAELLRKLQ